MASFPKEGEGGRGCGEGGIVKATRGTRGRDQMREGGVQFANVEQTAKHDSVKDMIRTGLV